MNLQVSKIEITSRPFRVEGHKIAIVALVLVVALIGVVTLGIVESKSDNANPAAPGQTGTNLGSNPGNGVAFQRDITLVVTPRLYIETKHYDYSSHTQE